MIATSNLTIQFGARPLFENVSVKFGNGNRYGLIGANGCGKSTFMKILGGDLEPSSGSVMRPVDVRLGKLRQDQFAYEPFSVLDTVIMGHEELWQVKAERDRIYALAEMSEDEGMAVADLEVRFAELDGYTAEVEKLSKADLAELAKTDSTDPSTTTNQQEHDPQLNDA